MRLVNTTDYPERDVRRLVVEGMGDDLARASWLTVKVMPRRSNQESSYAEGKGTRGPVTVILRIEQGPRAFPRDYSSATAEQRTAGYLAMSAETWQERLVFLAAHEANHVRLRRAGQGDEDTEVTADKVGLRKLRWYRFKHLLRLA